MFVSIRTRMNRCIVCLRPHTRQRAAGDEVVDSDGQISKGESQDGRRYAGVFGKVVAFNRGMGA